MILHPLADNVSGRTGSVPEWLMGADCKSAGAAYVGSNPTRPTFKSPCSSAVEHSLGKGEVSGSSPDEGIVGTQARDSDLRHWNRKLSKMDVQFLVHFVSI